MVQQMDQLQQDLATLAKIEELSQQLKVERQVLCVHACLLLCLHVLTIGVLCCLGCGRAWTLSSGRPCPELLRG